MRNKVHLLLILFFLSSTLVFSSEAPKLVKSKLPSDTAKFKNSILLNQDDIKEVIKGFNFEGIKANIEFADHTDKVLERLATVKKGKIKWYQKVAEKYFFRLKLDKKDFVKIKEAFSNNIPKPGYQIIISDSKTNTVIQSYEITFDEFPDLDVKMKYQVNIILDKELNTQITITLKNIGAAPAGETKLDLVISESNDFSQGSISLLGENKLAVRSLEPAEEIKVEFAQPLMLPVEVRPGRYYLGVIADVTKNLIELDEENNLFKGFVLLKVAEPESIIVSMPQTKFQYETANYGLKIISHGAILSDGKEWRKCRIRPYIFHLKHVTWQNYHWEVNTMDKSVWKITGAKFCNLGGQAKRIKAKVLAPGGSKTIAPPRVTLIIKDTRLIYKPASRKFEILSSGCQIAYLPFWKDCRPESYLYQFQYTLWTDFYWQFDIFRKTTSKITGGKFCRTGGDSQPLEITVKINPKIEK